MSNQLVTKATERSLTLYHTKEEAIIGLEQAIESACTADQNKAKAAFAVYVHSEGEKEKEKRKNYLSDMAEMSIKKSQAYDLLNAGAFLSFDECSSNAFSNYNPTAISVIYNAISTIDGMDYQSCVELHENGTITPEMSIKDLKGVFKSIKNSGQSEVVESEEQEAEANEEQETEKNEAMYNVSYTSGRAFKEVVSGVAYEEAINYINSTYSPLCSARADSNEGIKYFIQTNDKILMFIMKEVEGE